MTFRAVHGREKPQNSPQYTGSWRICSSWSSKAAPSIEKVIVSAAENGHLDIVQWALNQEYVMENAHLAAYAATGGHLHIMQFAKGRAGAAAGWLEVPGASPGIMERACADVAINGHLECLQFLRENNCPWEATECFLNAINSRHVAVVEWILQQVPSLRPSTTL
jgi:hypothetical protein